MRPHTRMKLVRCLPALAVALVALAGPGSVGSQPPGPHPRSAVEAVLKQVEAGRWEAALAAFETISREHAMPLPPEALRGWGVAASEAGRPLTAYVRLRQYLSRAPLAADREPIEERLDRLREALLGSAAEFSRVVASAERRPDWEFAGEHRLVRVAARNGGVSLEALAGSRIESPLWDRAEEIPMASYLQFLRRLLDTPALLDDIEPQTFDANTPGPRRAAMIRIVIGGEERGLQALRGSDYERIAEVVTTVLDFARTVTGIPSDAEPPAPAKPAPPRPRSQRR